MVIDEYTGTDFAWAWNAPLLQVGGSKGLLVTSGRCVSTAVIAFALYLILGKVWILYSALGCEPLATPLPTLLACHRHSRCERPACNRRIACVLGTSTLLN
jgi:hypothetical protein